MGLLLLIRDKKTKREKRNCQGQVLPFMILIVAVLLLAIAATMFIGEAGFQRLRLANIADSALISGTSTFCRSLNQINMISEGPGGLRMNYYTLQAFLLSKRSICKCQCPWWDPECKKTKVPPMWGWAYFGEPLAHPTFQNAMMQSANLYNQAEKLAEDMPKDLHVGLYDSTFGGALVDEPKPFLESEVTRENGRITGLNYTDYLKRDAHFTETLRDFKKGTGSFAGVPNAGPERWYKNKALSYSFNKEKKDVLAYPGKLTIGEADKNYKAFLRVELINLPNNVAVEPRIMPLVYWWLRKMYTPEGACYCVPTPAVLFAPYAWLNIDLDSRSFGLDVKKSAPFQRLPFFGRDVEMEHKNNVTIKGSRTMGYDFRMDE